MGFPDFLYGLAELGVSLACDWASNELGVEKPDEGSYTKQMLNKRDHSCIDAATKYRAC